jgi:hypothetical protein
MPPTGADPRATGGRCGAGSVEVLTTTAISRHGKKSQPGGQLAVSVGRQKYSIKSIIYKQQQAPVAARRQALAGRSSQVYVFIEFIDLARSLP